jgi:hypothetical protein
MKIWPWSKFEELEKETEKWIRNYMRVHKSRQQILKHFSPGDGSHYACISDQLCLFHDDGTWGPVKME